MGATTYVWSRDHLAQTGEEWAYDIPCWVFTHRDLEPLGEDIRFVSGDGHRAPRGDRGVGC